MRRYNSLGRIYAYLNRLIKREGSLNKTSIFGFNHLLNFRILVFIKIQTFEFNVTTLLNVFLKRLSVNLDVYRIFFWGGGLSSCYPF